MGIMGFGGNGGEKEGKKVKKGKREKNTSTRESSGIHGEPDAINPEPRASTLVQESNGQQPHSCHCCRIEQELEMLRLKYGELERGHNDLTKQELDMLRREYSELERGHNNLIKQHKILNEDNEKAKGRISWLEPQFKAINSFAPPLVKKLSDEEQEIFSNSRIDMPQILQSCLNQFNRLEDERVGHQLWYDDQIRNLKASHKTEIDTLNISHQNAVSKEMERKDEERNQLELRLQSEIDVLQKSLLTAIDDFRPISDADLKSRFSTLTKVVRDLARCPLGSNAEELGYAFNRADFTETAPEEHWRFLLESRFWIILQDGFFSNPFTVFGSYGDRYLSTWRNLFEKGDNDHQFAYDALHPGVASERWRSMTFGALLSAVFHSTSSHATNKDVRTSYKTHLEQVSQNLTNTLSKFSSKYSLSDIQDIIDQARQLALDIGTQRCRLQLFAPETNETVPKFNSSYSDVNNGNDVDVIKGVVRLVVSPGLRRTGEGRGYIFRESVDICPAHVYLAAVDVGNFSQ